MVQQATELSAHFARVKSVFAEGDLQRIAATLASIRQGLALVGNVPEFRGSSAKLAVRCSLPSVWLATFVQLPSLLSPFLAKIGFLPKRGPFCGEEWGFSAEIEGRLDGSEVLHGQHCLGLHLCCPTLCSKDTLTRTTFFVPRVRIPSPPFSKILALT